MSDTDAGGAHEEPYGYHYAVGAFDRLCRTEYCQPRERSVEDYDQTPSKEMVIDDMLQNGWPEETAEAAVDYLWEVKEIE